MLVAGCSESPFNQTTKIRDIISAPGKYSEKQVAVKGKVAESIIAFGIGYFALDDGSGNIAVIPAKTFPKVGEEVRIRGIVKPAFVVGEKSLVVVMESGKDKE